MGGAAGVVAGRSGLGEVLQGRARPCGSAPRQGLAQCPEVPDWYARSPSPATGAMVGAPRTLLTLGTVLNVSLLSRPFEKACLCASLSGSNVSGKFGSAAGMRRHTILQHGVENDLRDRAENMGVRRSAPSATMAGAPEPRHPLHRSSHLCPVNKPDPQVFGPSAGQGGHRGVGGCCAPLLAAALMAAS